MVISGRNEGWKEKPSMRNQESEKGKTDKSIIDFFLLFFLLEGTTGMKARLAKVLEDKHDQQCHTYRSPLRGQTKRSSQGIIMSQALGGGAGGGVEENACRSILEQRKFREVELAT